MKNFSIIFDPKLKHIALSLSKLTGAEAYSATDSFSVGEKFIVMWSYLGKTESETENLQGTVESLSSVGYVEALILLPSFHQNDNDIIDFQNEMYKIKDIGRVIFFDLTPISKLGMAGKPAINLSAFPMLISHLKQKNIKAKVITFNSELLVQSKVIESSIGKSERDILIIDNFIEDPLSLRPVVLAYFEKMYNIYVFSTYFLKDPSPLFPMANIISTNAILWEGVQAVDISPSIAEFINAIA